ncbi:uncharacterized protein LOC112555696 isoform X2 [Pomacea canaliculata]|uniref:uncharacterized protein LOC112555696 isoform X2 n=1 Tax=Pomacea canaliculata TaxID=400727 RepID=UPI000D735453|nr:uncharacterized protein LOC112555696 isoform X2 [Pomacea canaliculata]
MWTARPNRGNNTDSSCLPYRKAMASEAETFWLQWVEASFPDLGSRAYFLPPVYFNRVPRTRQSVAGQDVLVLQTSTNADRSNQPAMTSLEAAQSAVTLLDVAQPAITSLEAAQLDITSLAQSDVTPLETAQSDVTSLEAAQLEMMSVEAAQLDITSLEMAQLDMTSLEAAQLEMTSVEADQPSLSQPDPVRDSDVIQDKAMHRVLVCLQGMSEHRKEVFVAMSQCQFGEYVGETCYAAAAAQLPLPASLPPSLPRNWKEGGSNVLLIHRHYGLVVCEVTAFGDKVDKLNTSQQDIDNNIRQKLRDAVSQLDKAEAMLSHLVSDIAPGLRITKVIAVPNLTAHEVQQTVSGDTQLIQDLCRCLGTTDPADVTGLCLCSDQLSDPKAPWDVNREVLRELGNWWQRRVAGAGPDSHVTGDLYKILVARLCGPATTVTVPCTSPPRLSIKTLGQAVSHTGECYTAVITLYPEQVHLLHTAPPRLFVTGPPGTGKSVMLLLMGTEWLRCGHDVYVVSSWIETLAASTMLFHLLLTTVEKLRRAGQSPGQVHFLKYDGEQSVDKMVNDLSQLAKEDTLHVLEDEVSGGNLARYCDDLLRRIPRLHHWAASCFHGLASDNWQKEYLTRPLRSPPVVVREVQKDEHITRMEDVVPYSQRGVPDHTDGPPIRLLCHRGQGHSGDLPVDCVTCGREVASFLHSLRVGVTEEVVATSTTANSISSYPTPPCLRWRDVVVLWWNPLSESSGFVTGLRDAGIPVRVMKADDEEDVEDMAMARSDVVWAAEGGLVQGLERKVVICFKPYQGCVFSLRLHFMSRCASQLVFLTL